MKHLINPLQKIVKAGAFILLFCSIATLSIAQQSKTVKVKGVITDNSGAALAGVNVVVENTNIATSTSNKGEYTINTPAEGGGSCLFSAF